MRERYRITLILVAAAIPFVGALLLDGHVDPVLLWGGRICGSARKISAGCTIPPYALYTASICSVVLVDELFLAGKG